MEKRKKRELRKSRKSAVKNELSLDGKKNLQFLGIDNCIFIYLSPQTQRFIGCQIGENITAEQPWVYVTKEKIEDTLFLHENSSEFIPLRNLIEEYPEDKMLIGSYQTNKDKIEEFMICTTIDAKLMILELLEKEKESIIARVKNLIYCQPNKWNSLGSDVEIDRSQNVNRRNLIQVLFDLKSPITLGIEDTKFEYRLASVDPKFRTYDEIIPDRRHNKVLIFKTRIDRASQITPIRNNMEVQTILKYPINKYTQTNEVFLVLNLTEEETQKLENDMSGLLPFMEDTLLVNFHINLYQNDYMFPNSFIQSYAKQSKEIMNFQDVINCKDLCHGSVSWNAMASGLLAVSYVERPRNLIVKENYLNASVRSVFDDNMVLLWSYSDNLSAKLFIHVNFEITCISFCPYDENILVGGGASGRIVVWDLKDKLKQVESKEFLSPIELNHRNLLRAQTTWMKPPPGVRHVFPTIISDINMSHKSSVISIEWLPSYQCLTKLGQVENVPMQKRKTYLPPAKSYQFLTCSTEDSCVLAWEINSSSDMLKPASKKKHRRLKQLPESLIKGISPLKKFNKNFKPFFKFKLKHPGYPGHPGHPGEKLILVTDLILNNPKIEYVPLNRRTLDNIRERTFFRDVVPMSPKEHTQKFVFCSASGYLAECNWSANSYDQGQMINEQVCDTKVFSAIHDGPIFVCQSNLFYPECILTIGGSVFAVWITSANAKPIFWRKGSCRYVSGVWSLQYPLFCLVLREDNFMEYWDLMDCALKPLRKIKLKGNRIVDVIADAQRTHSRKKTYLLTDIKGAVRVQERAVFNTLLSCEEMRTMTVDVLNNMLTRKKHIENLNERLKKEYGLSQLHVLETCTPVAEIDFAPKSEVVDVQKRKNETSRPIRATKWQRKQELRMYETLLHQKGIDIAELEQNKIPVVEKLNKQLELQKKINQKLAMKEKIHDNKKKLLLESINITRRQKISVSFPRDMQQLIKDKYIEDYKLIEKEVLANINKKAGQRAPVNWEVVFEKRLIEGKKKM